MNELPEVAAFLETLPGFELLDDAALAEAARAISVAYFTAGSVILGIGATNTELHIIRSGAVELRDADGELVARSAEGEVFGLPSLLNAAPARNEARALEDTLVYQLDGPTLARLRSHHPAFDTYCVRTLSDRLLSEVAERRPSDPSGVTVGLLVTRPAVCIPATASIRDAARQMTNERVSALLVTENEKLVGILTDRDLRTRVVAVGTDTALPVSTAMTPEPVALDAAQSAHDAAIIMLDRNIHHLPITRQHELIGLVTRSDFMKLETEHPLYIVSAIRRQKTVESIAAECAMLPKLLLAQLESGAAPLQIGRFVTAISDAATRALIRLAEAELGTPPCRYAWVALGSQGRREQTARSDQDNALVLDDSATDADREYFANFAARVNAGLDASGFAYCPGEVMARNPQWCQPISTWKTYFRRWITEPEQEALMHANIFFDMRCVHGDARLVDELVESIRVPARANSIFLALMASNALTLEPPLGLFRQLVLERSGEHRDTLDLKRYGIMPVVELARVRCLATGEFRTGTRERLLAAAERREISRADADNLIDALDFIDGLRLEHQARQLRRGIEADNYLPPTEVSHLTRQNLKAAFSQIRVSQAALRNRFQAR